MGDSGKLTAFSATTSVVTSAMGTDFLVLSSFLLACNTPLAFFDRSRSSHSKLEADYSERSCLRRRYVFYRVHIHPPLCAFVDFWIYHRHCLVTGLWEKLGFALGNLEVCQDSHGSGSVTRPKTGGKRCFAVYLFVFWFR